MAHAGGIVLKVGPQRRKQLLAALSIDDQIAEAVPEFKHSRTAPLIVFMCFDDKHITHISQGRRGLKAGHMLSRLNMSNVVEMCPPISIARVLELIPSQIARYVKPRFSSGGLLSPKAFTSVVDAIRQIAESTRPLLDRFSETRRLAIERLGSPVKQALAYQKETVTTALAIADIDRDPLQTWSPPESLDASTSFLDGLETVRVREDPMVINDMAQIPGFEHVRTMRYGAAVFKNDKTRLTVVLANRLPLEKQLGADLIYYNERFKSFIIVQYKAMEKEGQDAVYRLPNAQLAKEIERMDVVLAELRKCAPTSHRQGFRVTENPFFLKLCPRIVLNPDDKGLTPGMYIPLDYWRFLETDSDVIGKKGGRVITYENIGRYFDNTSFIGLVSNAWIGTTEAQSLVLEDVIKAVIESGRTVTIAVKIPLNKTASGDEEIDDDAPDSN